MSHFPLLRPLRLSGALVTLALLTAPVAAGDLKLRIVPAAAGGAVHLYVFTSADGFPKEESAALHFEYPAPAHKEIVIRVKVPDAAEYALMAYQDKNGDGKMNRLLGMIPLEPYGLSRNPQVFGKPEFADAAVRGGELEPIVIILHD